MIRLRALLTVGDGFFGGLRCDPAVGRIAPLDLPRHRHPDLGRLLLTRHGHTLLMKLGTPWRSDRRRSCGSGTGCSRGAAPTGAATGTAATAELVHRRLTDAAAVYDHLRGDAFPIRAQFPNRPPHGGKLVAANAALVGLLDVVPAVWVAPCDSRGSVGTRR